jgi:hypothetical protein
MQIVRLVIIALIVMGMGWIRQKPLPKPDAPEIGITKVVCR